MATVDFDTRFGDLNKLENFLTHGGFEIHPLDALIREVKKGPDTVGCICTKWNKIYSRNSDFQKVLSSQYFSPSNSSIVNFNYAYSNNS